MKKIIVLFFLAIVFLSACTKEIVKPQEGPFPDPNGKPYASLDNGGMIDPNGKPYASSDNGGSWDPNGKP